MEKVLYSVFLLLLREATASTSHGIGSAVVSYAPALPTCEEKGGTCYDIPTPGGSTDCDLEVNIYKPHLCRPTTVTQVCCIPRETVCTSLGGTCSTDPDTCLAMGSFYSWFSCNLADGEPDGRCCIPTKKVTFKVFPLRGSFGKGRPGRGYEVKGQGGHGQVGYSSSSGSIHGGYGSGFGSSLGGYGSSSGISHGGYGGSSGSSHGGYGSSSGISHSGYASSSGISHGGYGSSSSSTHNGYGGSSVVGHSGYAAGHSSNLGHASSRRPGYVSTLSNVHGGIGQVRGGYSSSLNRGHSGGYLGHFAGRGYGQGQKGYGVGSSSSKGFTSKLNGYIGGFLRH